MIHRFRVCTATQKRSITVSGFTVEWIYPEHSETEEGILRHEKAMSIACERFANDEDILEVQIWNALGILCYSDQRKPVYYDEENICKCCGGYKVRDSVKSAQERFNDWYGD